jgi:hypothetical protein
LLGAFYEHPGGVGLYTSSIHLPSVKKNERERKRKGKKRRFCIAT